MFIYCDNAAHRRVAVTNLVKLPGPLGRSGWHEQPASRASTGHVGTGRTMLGDQPAETGWALGEQDEPTRNRYELSCRKCGARVPAREETLWVALDVLAAHGVSEGSLTLLGATIAVQSK